MRCSALTLLLFLVAPSAYGAQESLSLGNVFSDHMVLQRDQPGRTWDLTQTGFEEVPPGPFTTLETTAGRLTAAEGHAVIDADHHKSGQQCLHIVGGEERRVVLEPRTGDEEVGELTFWAERWTRREPFVFRIESFSEGTWREIYVGDPCVLVDRETGTIWVGATWSHGNRSWNGSGPGLSPAETGQLMLVRSDDDGLTWSTPINITEQVKQPEWCFLLLGPGRGISLRDGTLVFPAQYQDTPENGRTPHSTILYSTDHGETWHLGTGAKPNTTESQVVELEDGVLMLNMRDNRGGWRSVYTTSDLGRTWQEHPTSRKSLIEPVCNASLIHAGGSTLLFVNPAVPRAPRRRMTLKASTDLGMTWPAANQLLLDEGQSAGYPSLSMIDESTVGILFESSRAHMTFMRIPLSDLIR